ncbi:allophanate hydrolase [Tamlana nanhaiensis]|uniref:Allophanate hydrolase n=1 Tax=Neotamlana nanhaiensis TaxID=1382798 RepID=A0A0D7W1W5_9FLAO|nr:biotin-dependent carboxyltransferase family protein [Tamlana nanhaiensis]KJD33081.1 allophanate hydrolase [Tamlana nanhaiensis]
MLKVLHAGFYTSVQDFGRNNHQYIGVPFSGAMDKKAATFANAILGNNPNEAVLEMTMLGAKVQFNQPTVVAISGADMDTKINNTKILRYKAIVVNSGDVLSFGKLKQGFRAYLAVLGGFKTPTVLGSKSMYATITENQIIKKGDALSYNTIPSNYRPSFASIKFNDDYLKSSTIEVFKGAEFDLLSKEQQEQLLSQPFTISKDNNRMAYQLAETLENTLEPIITSAVLPGTVQLTPSGKLIVLMRDCQTTGGYPRVLQLTEEALNILAQKFTGASVSFKLKAKKKK